MNVATSMLSEPSIILGVVAFAGLVLQKKPLTKVFEGTLKAMIGFLIFNLGNSAITGTLRSLNTLFQVGFHIDGVMAMSEAAVALVKENYGYVVSATFIMASMADLLFAKFTRFKNIVFLTSIQFMFDAMLVLVIKPHGYSDTAAALVGDISIGFVSAFLPELCRLFVRKITGSDGMTISRFSMCACALSGYIGKLSSRYGNESTGDPKPPG